MLLQLVGIGKSFATRRLLGDVCLDVRAGERVALVGPNGSGKTTLLRIAADLEAPDEGRLVRARGLRIGFLRQEIDPRAPRSVREEASLALAWLDDLARELTELEAEIARVGADGVPAELAARYDRTRARFELGGGFERGARVDRVLEGLGFDATDRDRPLSSWSGGWLMRVELAKLLLAEPDLLLLDEPTNHLDLPSIEWFESVLAGFRGAVLAVSHDRAFLRSFATRVAELSGGAVAIYEGGYDHYLRERSARREQLLARERAQAREIEHTERFIERFRYKASKARQVQSRVKALARIERVVVTPDRRKSMRLRVPPPERAGDVVVRLAGVHKRYADTVVYQGLDFSLRRGERVALVGPNGAGKSTLLRILAGVLPFESGERALGHRVRIAFYAQHQLEVLDPARSVLQELAVEARTEDWPRLRGHLGAFLFSGDEVEKPVAVLSGGEKARLALAKLLLRPANFLVLDEPTNHLDVDACEVLESALKSYGGTLVFVSHDRSFIDAVATRIVEVRAGHLREIGGRYADAPRPPAEIPAAVPGHGGPRAPVMPASAPRQEPREERRATREREKARQRVIRQLSALEAAIAEREAALEALGWQLGAPDLWRDAERARQLSAEREATREEVAGLYRTWERLAAELEAFEHAPPDGP